jgi:hypothetical protein
MAVFATTSQPLLVAVPLASVNAHWIFLKASESELAPSPPPLC